MAERPWRTLTSRPIYHSPWVDLREDGVELPSGGRIRHAVVTLATAHSVGVLPLLPSGEVILVRQYRYVQDGWFWESPSGAPQPGEPLEAAAQRELREEAGYRAGRLVPLTAFHTSKSVCRETAHLYAGLDLLRDPLPPDATEDIEVSHFPAAEVGRMVERAEIMDAMTVVAVLTAARTGLLS